MQSEIMITIITINNAFRFVYNQQRKNKWHAASARRYREKWLNILVNYKE